MGFLKFAENPYACQGDCMRTGISFGLSVAIALCACAHNPRAASDYDVSGERAMAYVRAQVDIGPRPPGSPQIEKCREFIKRQLRDFGYQVADDAFVANTPYGLITMDNLIARREAAGNKGIIALASHYDTKMLEGKNFVGANDGGSSTGLLLELARVLAARKEPLEYRFLFLDGEEAFVEWSTFDSTYGSRHLADRWKQDGTAPKIRALILLDMIGDKDLDILYETNSTGYLMDLVWKRAAETGLQGIRSGVRASIQDDHIPFLDAGIPSVDIIDFNYGPGNSYWHTSEDTLDKISPQSLEKVGRLVLSVLSFLQKKY
jgi:glutaminyl-peptide cyclotransferase